MELTGMEKLMSITCKILLISMFNTKKVREIELTLASFIIIIGSFSQNLKR